MKKPAAKSLPLAKGRGNARPEGDEAQGAGPRVGGGLTSDPTDPSNPTDPPAPDISREIDGLCQLPINKVLRSALNPRKHFDETYINELAESIRTHGQLQPIVVRPTLGGFRGFFDIIMGECRHRACELAGLTTINAIIRADITTDQQHITLALIENLQRRDLDPIEEARGYNELANLGMPQKEICAKVNRSQAAVSNAMRLLKLPEEVLELITAGALPVASGLALVRHAAFPGVVIAMARFAIKQKVPSKDLEKDSHWGLWYDLFGQKLAVEINGMQGFTKACNACPFGAFLKTGDNSGRCLKPEHYAELEAADRAIQEAKVRKETEALKKRAESNPKLAEKISAAGFASLTPQALTSKSSKALWLKDLDYGKYERISGSSDPVAGCTAACECRAVALDTNGNPCQICIMPGHRNALKAQATRERRKIVKAEGEQTVSTWRQVCEDGTAPIGSPAHKRITFSPALRSIAVAAWTILRSSPVEIKRAVAKPLPEGPFKALLCQVGHEVKALDAWQILEAEPWYLIFEALGEIRLREETAGRIENAYHRTPIQDYLLNPRKTASAPSAHSGEGEEESTPSARAEIPRYIECSGCLGLMRLVTVGNGPTKVTRYECGCGLTELPCGKPAAPNPGFDQAVVTSSPPHPFTPSPPQDFPSCGSPLDADNRCGCGHGHDLPPTLRREKVKA